MQQQILNELKQLKEVLAILAGTANLSTREQFSRPALDKAAKQFQKLAIERDEWVNDDKISKYIKNAGYHAGNVIRSEFLFKNYFKRGHTYYYYKKDLITLNDELKKRNIDLGRYIEIVNDQVKFRKYLDRVNEEKSNTAKKQFRIPKGLKNITTSPPPFPDAEIIRADIKRLKDEFFEFKLDQYIDIYRGTYAMMKHVYCFQKYMASDLMKRCRKWCDNFNYANTALEKVTKKKEHFNPVKDEDMIEL